MTFAQETRPWGSWHVIDEAVGFKVKRIHVAPGCRLSLQSHRHRSEHWVVVRGVALCHVGGKVFRAVPGECVDVPIGVHHRLENRESSPLVVVEVQRGVYTGEDDIVRYEDDYGRHTAVS
jgi:mannose-6-phosphate isomerase